jgi:hypothetical protein
MKKSTKVTLTVVAVMGLAACGSRRDPCDPAYFNDFACQEAIRGGGYYWNGSWVPVRYSYPYPYYYDHYRTYVVGGGHVSSSPSGSYASPSVTRGGFGSTGAAHAAGAGE